jgi:hypothetical protein
LRIIEDKNINKEEKKDKKRKRPVESVYKSAQLPIKIRFPTPSLPALSLS